MYFKGAVWREGGIESVHVCVPKEREREKEKMRIYLIYWYAYQTLSRPKFGPGRTQDPCSSVLVSLIHHPLLPGMRISWTLELEQNWDSYLYTPL